MSGLLYYGVTREMTTEERADLDGVLRTLKLAQAQLLNLKKHFRNDSNRAQELADIEVALNMILKRLSSLAP